jgi:hypothetical protein
MANRNLANWHFANKHLANWHFANGHYADSDMSKNIWKEKLIANRVLTANICLKDI